MSSKFCLISVTLISYLMLEIHGHNGCGVDRIKNNKVIKNENIKPKTIKSSHHNHNGLEGRAEGPASFFAAFENIRILFDTSKLESDWSDYGRLDYFVNDVIPAAEEWLEKAIKVRPGMDIYENF